MQNDELNIYLLPGMGADRRLYDPMTIEGGKLHFIEWEFIEGISSLADYARILTERIDTENNVYIGSSMGGMMAVEMHFHKPADRLVLLSAPAHRPEFPPVLNNISRVRMGKWFSPKQIFKINRLADSFMGFSNEEDRKVFYEMLEAYGPDFLHYAVNAILHWDRRERPQDYLQIIGAKDRLFKAKRMQSPIVIPDAGHFMTYEQPQRLSDLINQELEKVRETLKEELR